MFDTTLAIKIGNVTILVCDLQKRGKYTTSQYKVMSLKLLKFIISFIFGENSYMFTQHSLSNSTYVSTDVMKQFF